MRGTCTSWRFSSGIRNEDKALASALHLRYLVEGGKNKAYSFLRGENDRGEPKLPHHDDLIAMLKEPLEVMRQDALNAIELVQCPVSRLLENASAASKSDGHSTLFQRKAPPADNIPTEVQRLVNTVRVPGKVDNRLLNDIVDTSLIYSGGFYRHFPLGTSGNFVDSRVKLLLRHENPAIESDVRFSSYMASGQRRKKTNVAGKFAIKSGGGRSKKFKDMCIDEKFVETLEKHVINPMTKACADFLKNLRPLVHRAESNLDWTPQRKKRNNGQLYAMVRRFALLHFDHPFLRA